MLLWAVTSSRPILLLCAVSVVASEYDNSVKNTYWTSHGWSRLQSRSLPIQTFQWLLTRFCTCWPYQTSTDQQLIISTSTDIV